MLAAAAIALALGSPLSLTAHHSLGNHDTATAIRVKGTVVRFQPVNPHSFILLEQTGADGSLHRWAVEGPGAFQLTRRGVAADALKPGDVIEVCGYMPKERTVWQLSLPAPEGASLSGRLITAELLVMPDGREQSWGDYGVHRCFPKGYKDQHPQQG
jgi:hypothetical protein